MTNYIIDILFAVDMIVIFNSAYYDEDLMLVEDRCQISYNYLTSWFLIDLICIIPFDLMF